MNYFARASAVAGLFLLAACNNGGFGDGEDVFLGGPGSGGAGAGFDQGSADDPTSPLYFQQTVGDRVFFDVDQSTLNDSARFALEGQATWLISNPDYSVIIEGHADEQGTREYNLALGARRANAVQEYLAAQGVNSTRLKVVSFGKERPIEICSEEACYAKNRRSVTVVSAGINS